MKDRTKLSNCVPGFNIVWAVKPENKPAKARKHWPRLRVINNTLVAFAETAIAITEPAATRNKR
jgi:hypothetical protein